MLLSSGPEGWVGTSWKQPRRRPPDEPQSTRTAAWGPITTCWLGLWISWSETTRMGHQSPEAERVVMAGKANDREDRHR
jgi:hypothetical protein